MIDCLKQRIVKIIHKHNNKEEQKISIHRMISKCARLLTLKHSNKIFLFTGSRKPIGNTPFNKRYSKSFGSGFFVKHGNKKYLVTALHVVDALKSNIDNDSVIIRPGSTYAHNKGEVAINFGKLDKEKCTVIQDKTNDYYIKEIDQEIIPDEDCFDINNILNFNPWEDAVSFCGYPYSRNKNIDLHNILNNRIVFMHTVDKIDSLENDFIYLNYSNLYNAHRHKIKGVSLKSMSGCPLLSINEAGYVAPIGILLEYSKNDKKIKFANLKTIISRNGREFI